MKFLNNIDLDSNQIINVIIERRTGADGVGVEGQIIYREDLDIIKYYDGSVWVTLASASSAVASVTAGDGLANSGTASNPILDINVDDATIEINADTVRIKALGVGSGQLANNAVTTVKITDSNVTFAKIQDVPTMTVLGRVIAGSGVVSAISILDEDNMVSDSATALATQQSIKAYVDSTVSSLGALQGGYSASVNTDFPSGANSGDYWYITSAGTIQGMVLNNGDVIIATVDNAAVDDASDWTAVESNREQASTTVIGVTRFATTGEAQGLSDNTVALTPAGLASVTATETRTGIIELATEAETLVGTDDTRAVTPLKLEAKLANQRFAANLGNGSATSIAITHNLGTLDVICYVRENSSGALVIPDITHNTINQVTVIFATAPTSNQYRIVIQK